MSYFSQWPVRRNILLAVAVVGTGYFLKRSIDNASSKRKKRFAVLLAGHLPNPVTKNHGGYGDLVRECVRAGSESDEWHTYKVEFGEFPDEAQIDDYDGFVISGSAHDAHSDVPFVVKLRSLIQTIHVKKKKLVGICFGHQIIALALGGNAGRADVGWELGIRELEVTTEFSKLYPEFDLHPQFRVAESHRDQVLSLPDHATLLASSKRTPIEMYQIADNVLSMQGHPEFTTQCIHDLAMASYSTGRISEADKDFSMKFMDMKPTTSLLQKLMRSFLNK